MPPGRPLFPLLSDLETSVAAAEQIHSPAAEASSKAAAAETSTPPPSAASRPWFLGLDIGTLGLSAVLLNHATGQQMPVFWQQPESQQRWFHWSIDSAIGPAEIAAPTSVEAAILCQLKPALALPLRRGLAGTREHLPTQEPVYRPLAQMLATLLTTPDSAPSNEETSWRCGAVGLEPADFAAAMQALAGIGVSYPAGWPNQYQTNVQNAILEAKLVTQPSDIYFVREAIAAALAYLPLPAAAGQPPSAKGVAPEGLAFVLSAGTSTSELALTDLAALAQGDCSGLASRTVAYGGRALDQDILLYLLYPQLQNSPLAEVEQLLTALQLDTLEQPRLGHSDSAQRLRLHLRLCGSAPGRQLLAIAQQLKQDLQTRSRSTYILAQHRGQITRDDLGHRILLPYIHLLTQQTQALIEQANITPDAVRYSICAGRTAAMPVVHLWARQCFPQATLCCAPTRKVLEAGIAAEAAETAWLGSPVGYGLAKLPLVVPPLST